MDLNLKESDYYDLTEKFLFIVILVVSFVALILVPFMIARDMTLHFLILVLILVEAMNLMISFKTHRATVKK
jgi:hypothetical protein